MFKPVSTQVDFPSQEKKLLDHWYSSGIVTKYLTRNSSSNKKFVFLDGPITANNPMGVHHAWGRTYKDLWQRYHTMRGEAQRFQNGFDCQGLWVEVEVEKELGFKSKKDIETYGVANFVNKCKERVVKYSSIQTEQSKRLGYFMDWDNSYFTMSDDNNYSIWSFLKECWQRGWIYKGHDVVPWCPRCETAISQHEILTEDYKELTHKSVFLALPIVGRSQEHLLIWTTTPWTLPANTAVAVDETLKYSLVESSENHQSYWIASDLVEKVFSTLPHQIKKTILGGELVGLHYQSPFDDLPLIRQALGESPDKFHVVIATDNILMPISTEEGTGLVHTSTSTGEEDHKLGKIRGLPVIPAIDDAANYLDGFGQFSGQNAKKHPELIIDYLTSLDKTHFLFSVLPYTHRYPACWRCKAELVWKVADEWYIAMDKPDPTDKQSRTFRQQMIDVTKQINWIPGFGLDRELDWLNNMHDWLISKKNRYWGLALPIYECVACQTFEVLGSKKELEDRSSSGWDKFVGNSPHKPWIDEVKIKCAKCSQTISRISDVGNPWLDAGIVSISTLPDGWFPADFITESFPGQFKNWFYSLIAMSTVMKKTHPFKSVLGYASLLAEDGRPMHKSWGNSIEFNEGADKIGVDVMRWMFVTQNPENNLLFGHKKADEVRRQFHLMLWNIYNFYITYAKIDGFIPNQDSPSAPQNVLDKWIRCRMSEVVEDVTAKLDSYDAYSAAATITDFVNDLSLWYVRRSRDRVGPAAVNNTDKSGFHTIMYSVLIDLTKVLAPFIPFMADEIFTNITDLESVHLADWPSFTKLTSGENQLLDHMKSVRKIVELGLSKRKELGLKVRQPLALVTISSPESPLSADLEGLILDELNVKQAQWIKSKDLSVELDTAITPELQAEGDLRELVRQVQDSRKRLNVGLNQYISLGAPLPQSAELVSELKRKTLAKEIYQSSEIIIKII